VISSQAFSGTISIASGNGSIGSCGAFAEQPTTTSDMSSNQSM